MIWKKPLHYLGIITGLFLAPGCGDSVSDPHVGRIIPWESIDGIEIEDTPDTVLSAVGRAEKRGDWDGEHGGGLVYIYTKGTHAGLEVLFTERDSVVSLRAKDTYSGKTVEGIGIGTPLDLLHQIHGVPDTSTRNYQQYFKEDRSFGVTHTDGKIDAIYIDNTHYFKAP